MDNKKIFKKILVFCAIFFIFGLVLSSVNAVTNPAYGEGLVYSGEEQKGIAATVLGWIQDAILGLIGKAIAGLAFCVEVIVRGACALLTMEWSNQIFPWSDRVIFNGMALLDVNFINPAKGSLFMNSSGAYTTIGNTIRNIYFTGLSLALGFLGIIVAVMAIRLAISSIASEKAKYKEAIVHWITALVLLFGMHYIISFVFYVNEQMVEVASNMVSSMMTNTTLQTFWGSSSTYTTPLESLGIYFRDVAFKTWNTTSFTSAILYAVFVIQSLMFFYAYLKRFFYVTILAVISPFVIVYDFLVKAVK